MFWGWGVIVEAFLRWSETAKAGDRAKAANALGRAYLQCLAGTERQRAAGLTMTYLLDDPSPRVRLALAEALADADIAPRGVIISLAEDQPEIACTVITRSPVLTDDDLVDLAGRGDSLRRGIIAARPSLSRCVAAAIAEIGDEGEALILLENETASITRASLRRLAERFGHRCDIRNMLLDREDLPADARHMLVTCVADTLLRSPLVCGTMASGRIEHVMREAGEAATVTIAGIASTNEVMALVEHLRAGGHLTPAFLIHALCTGKVDFFAKAMVSLSGLEERRVRSILATARVHAVRALLEAAGLSRELAEVSVEAVLLWRQAASELAVGSISLRLLERLRQDRNTLAAPVEVLDMLEKLCRVEERLNARSYASRLSIAA